MPGKLSFNSRWVLRYAAAVAAVGAGLLLRLGLTAFVGEGLATYITFYPVIMAVALLGGFGPGLVATLTTALAVDYWILPPTHAFSVASLADAVGLAFFSGMGIFMTWWLNSTAAPGRKRWLMIRDFSGGKARRCRGSHSGKPCCWPADWS